jgi:hypothetical protein
VLGIAVGVGVGASVGFGVTTGVGVALPVHAPTSCHKVKLAFGFQFAPTYATCVVRAW